MKKNTVLPVILAFLAACTNPVLKWIDTPGDIITNSGSGTGPLTPSASDKAITTFSFGIEGEEISIRAEPDQDGTIPIKAVLPVNTGITGLSPSITWIGASITPPDGTVRTARPYADSSRNFTNPLVYTVRAGDGTTQIYTVQVYVKTAQSAEIIWCDVELGGGRMAEGVVNQPAAGGTGEIIIRVPSGTNTANLTAKIAQTGKSLSAPNAVGTQNLSGTAISLRGNFSVASSAAERTYTVTAEDGSKKEYEVTVIVDKSTVKEITAFSFGLGSNNEYVIIGAEPRADGVYPIVATVPGSEEVSSLTPAVNYKGAGITGAGISVSRTANFDDDSSPVTANPAHQDFSAPVSYRVTAEDTTFRDYEVTVYRSDLNSKQITGFYFPFLNNAQGTQGPAGIINETAKTIAITVPAGTNLNALAPAVYHTGASISPLSGEPKNFSNSIAVPGIYTVTARNGSTQPYKVSVFVAKRSDKAITAFDFSNVSGETTVIGGTPGADGI
ncbi:MAG: DUF5018 domain-containing protein, partial [Treponema sp.]|nr:DUF5018 domain-containing protein [Treponema sp.]